MPADWSWYGVWTLRDSSGSQLGLAKLVFESGTLQLSFTVVHPALGAGLIDCPKQPVDPVGLSNRLDLAVFVQAQQGAGSLEASLNLLRDLNPDSAAGFISVAGRTRALCYAGR